MYILLPFTRNVEDSQIDPVALSAQCELSKQARIILKGGEMMPLDLTGVDDESDGEEEGEDMEEEGGELDASKDSETMSAPEIITLEGEDLEVDLQQTTVEDSQGVASRRVGYYNVGGGSGGRFTVGVSHNTGKTYCNIFSLYCDTLFSLYFQ